MLAAKSEVQVDNEEVRVTEWRSCFLAAELQRLVAVRQDLQDIERLIDDGKDGLRRGRHGHRSERPPDEQFTQRENAKDLDQRESGDVDANRRCQGEHDVVDCVALSRS